MLKAAIALALLTVPGAALAQSAQCVVPEVILRPTIEKPSVQEPRRMLPTGGYTLALSWSPQFCATARRGGNAFQCGGRGGRFGFTLHGLWPDGVGKAWPQYCRPAELLPRVVIRQNLCMTPSVQLIQHEWAKHGTCMATRPDLYFDLARAFYQSIRYPDMAGLSRRTSLTVGQFIDLFVAGNKGLRADMVRVTLARDNRLSEIWLCMDRVLEFARCPAHKGGAANGALLRITPGPIFSQVRRAAPPMAKSVPSRKTSPIVKTPPKGVPARAVSPARPAPARAPGPASRPEQTPARRPGLILDLDPHVQPIGNGAG